MTKQMIFPAGFLWGASTSAFQVEGGYNEGGKGVATTDLGTRRPGVADNKVAADHYHHWKEDVDLMAELGLKVYRMGFSWSRIMPDASGKPNPEGLAFYDRLIDYLLEKGIDQCSLAMVNVCNDSNISYLLIPDSHNEWNIQLNKSLHHMIFQEDFTSKTIGYKVIPSA